MAAFPAPISSRSLTIRCRASTMSGIWPTSPRARRAGRKARAASASFGSPSNTRRRNSGSGSSGVRGSISTSSIIPANGCSTCRCSGSTMRSGRGPHSSRAARRAEGGGEGLARGTCRGRSGSARRRDAGRETCRSVQGLFARHPRRRSRAIDAAAWALPHAWRSRRLAGAHLRAARRKGRREFPARLALRHDGAALRGL